VAHVTAEAKLGAKVLGTPRVFYEKRLHSLDYKGDDFLGDDKEAARD